MAHRFQMRIGGRTINLPLGQLDVGRVSECWLRLEDDLTSRYHTRFYVGAEALEIEDLRSRNGTYVNGKRIEGRVELTDGDKVRIGREVITILGSASTVDDVDDDLRKTAAPGENTQVPSLIGQLVDKSLEAGKIKEAERYVVALANQLMGQKVASDHPTARSCVRSLVAVANQTASGVWIDRVFGLYAAQGWIMTTDVLEDVRKALDRIPRVPGRGLKDYERALRVSIKSGAKVPPDLASSIAELVDAYGGG